MIARGAVESAVQIARHARYRSIQYQERIRRIIADTLIDPEAHDWISDVPTLLETALSHVRERLQAEAALLDAVAERRAEVDDAARLRAANQLIEILRECRRRHDELHGHLIGARARLREALDDRLARAPRTVRRANLAADLLHPYLTRPTYDAAAAADRMLAMVGGFPTRWLPSLITLTDELCAPSRVSEPGDEVIPPEFDDADVPEWWEPYEDTVTAILDAVDEPVYLSQLLARTGSVAEDVTDVDGQPLDARTLADATVHAAHRAWAARLSGRAAGDRVLIAVDTGRQIDTEDVRSADLLLMPGIVVADIAEPTRLAQRHNDHLEDGSVDNQDDIWEEVAF